MGILSDMFMMGGAAGLFPGLGALGAPAMGLMALKGLGAGVGGGAASALMGLRGLGGQSGPGMMAQPKGFLSMPQGMLTGSSGILGGQSGVIARLKRLWQQNNQGQTEIPVGLQGDGSWVS